MCHYRARGNFNAGTESRIAICGTSKPSWASNLHPVGLHYYAGIVDNAEELMEEHKVETQSSFGTRGSTKKEGFQCSTSFNKENDNPNETVTSKVRLTFIISDNINYNTQHCMH